MKSGLNRGDIMARVQVPVFITGIERHDPYESPVELTLTIRMPASKIRSIEDMARFSPIMDAYDQRKPVIMTLDIPDEGGNDIS